MSALGWWLVSSAGYLLVAAGVARAVYAEDYVAATRHFQRRRDTTRRPRSDELNDEFAPGLVYAVVGLGWPLWLPFWLAWRVVQPIAPLAVAWWKRGIDRRLNRAGL